MDCKLALGLLLLSLTSACLAFECLEDGAFRDAEDCGMYWVCDQTGMFHMPCPEGLYFNEGQGVCDYPENVPECPFVCTEDGWFMDRLDCNKYYVCVGEQQFHMACPEDLWFNDVEQICDWQENVQDCPLTPTDAPTEAPTTDAPTTVPVPTDAPTTAAPTTPEPTTPEPTTPEPTTPEPTTPEPTTTAPTTPPTTLAPTTESDAPTTAAPTTAAPTTAAPTTAAPTTPGPTPEPFECPGDGFYMASTCVDYWRCLGDRKWLMPCPDGLWFNTAEEACDWPENVPECSMDPPTYPPTTAAPTTAAPTTPVPTELPTTTLAPTTAAPTTAAPTTAAPTTAAPTTAVPTYPPTTPEPTTPEPTTPEPTTPEPTTPEPTTPEPTTPEPTTPEPTTPEPTTGPGPTEDTCRDEWDDCDYESMCDEAEIVNMYCRQTCGTC